MRVLVAMSGGVDSAVALLHGGPEAVGVTLRLWLDPQGPSAERACCSPDAVIAAREACHALGRPHVTLDLREEFRRAIVERLSQDSIVEALSNVPHDFRDAIVLVDIGDFSYQEAAQILDVPIGTIMSRLHRGRRILKGELAESVGGEEQ